MALALTMVANAGAKGPQSAKMVGNLSASWLKDLCRKAGADDVGLVRITRPELDDQRADILRAFPQTRALISLVIRMNREPIRSVSRSVANLEFHHAADEANDIARDIVRQLEDMGIAALNPPMGFPMEMENYPGKIWVVSHKPVAVAAGLGRMGIHRNVIHPRFGNFILLATVLLGAEVDAEDQPIDFNPCLSCKLCVAACPVGAIKPDGRFDPSACMTHNYREFMGGFVDWTERVTQARGPAAYGKTTSESETASMWQSLSFGANYKAAYCLSVCPAGEEVIGPYQENKPAFLAKTLKPLQEKIEPVYVVPHSDAEEYVRRRFPHKTPRPARGVRPTSVKGFLSGMPIVFQSGQSEGLSAVYHFDFHGAETAQATVTIRDRSLRVESGLLGRADCSVKADAATWIGFLRKEKSIVWAILRRKIRVKGRLSLLSAFGKCFPS